MKKMLTLLCILILAGPLSFAGKKKTKEAEVIPQMRPDKALVYICGGGYVFLDDSYFGAAIGRNGCTFDYIDPGTHYLWGSYSKFVDPLVLSVIEWDFEPGQTYYFNKSVTTDYTWGADDITSFQLLGEESGERVVAASKKISVGPTLNKEKFLQRKLKRYNPDGANNALIASRRLEQGIAKGKSAETKDRADAAQGYEEATRLLADAANKYDELARITRKRKTNVAIGNILGPMLATASAQIQAQNSMVPTPEGGQSGVGVALYTITSTKSFKGLIAEYESFATEARLKAAEYLRRLACYNSSGDDDVIASCVGEVNNEK